MSANISDHLTVEIGMGLLLSPFSSFVSLTLSLKTSSSIQQKGNKLSKMGSPTCLLVCDQAGLNINFISKTLITYCVLSAFPCLVFDDHRLDTPKRNMCYFLYSVFLLVIVIGILRVCLKIAMKHQTEIVNGILILAEK